MVFVVDTVRIYVMVSIVFLFCFIQQGCSKENVMAYRYKQHEGDKTLPELYFLGELVYN